jgi:hypothetical protein
MDVLISGQYILSKIILHLREQTNLYFELPKTKIKSKKWLMAIKDLNVALEYNLLFYKKTIGETLTIFQLDFLRKYQAFSGLNFLPQQIIYVKNVLNKVKLKLLNDYPFLPYRNKSIFFNQSSESATKKAENLINNSFQNNI